MAPKLKWKPNAKKWRSKALKAFYILIRNTSASTKVSVKQCVGRICGTNCYICNSSLVRLQNGDEDERVQKKATSLILNNWELNYKKRLGKLNLLPLSLYIELHDLLLLISFLSGNYIISIPISRNPNCDDQPITRQFELININQTRTKKADENFWRRSSQILNI